MPEERTITVYKYDELEGEAQERARMKVGEWNAEWENKCLQHTFEMYLEERGLPTDKIEWSLSHSQGDGVAFYGDMDVEKFLRYLKVWSKWRIFHDKDLYGRIDRNSWGYHYSHYNTMDVIVGANYSETDRHHQLLDELRDFVEEEVRNVSHKLETIGYNAIEYAYSDEAVREMCEANEYLFHSNGSVA